MAEILVVEDDESMNDILVRSLQGKGHTVSSAQNAPRAIELSLSQGFDLLITDVILPGDDGLECLVQVRMLQAQVRCIVITGYARPEIPARAVRLKIDDYLLKPFTMQTFLAAVEDVLDTNGDRATRQSVLDRLLPTARDAQPEEILQLESHRRDAIRALYVGVRSGFLTRVAARTAYGMLESLEEAYRQQSMKLLPETQVLSESGLSYSRVSGWIAAFNSGKSQTPPVSVNPIPQEQITKLVEGIKAFRIGLHDLEYAPLLRRISNKRLLHHRELLDLKRLLWPSLFD